MDAQIVPCPHCHVALRFSEKFRGKKIRCPKCASTMSIPQHDDPPTNRQMSTSLQLTAPLPPSAHPLSPNDDAEAPTLDEIPSSSDDDAEAPTLEEITSDQRARFKKDDRAAASIRKPAKPAFGVGTIVGFIGGAAVLLIGAGITLWMLFCWAASIPASESARL